MQAHAMSLGERGCGRRDRDALRAALHAMGARGGGARHWRGAGGPGAGGLGGLGAGGHRRGRKARRGDVRSAILLLLAEQPRNGYQIMQELEERSGGLWSPSPGSVYPALQQLEDEQLISAEEVDGRRLFALTDAGRRQVDARGPERPAPWEELRRDAGDHVQELAQSMRAAAAAAVQVLRTGSDVQLAQAQRILTRARRELYRVLAGDDEEETPAGADE